MLLFVLDAEIGTGWDRESEAATQRVPAHNLQNHAVQAVEFRPHKQRAP